MTNILTPSEIGDLLTEVAESRKDAAEPGQKDILFDDYAKNPFRDEVKHVAQVIGSKGSVEECKQYLRDDEHARAVVGAVVAQVEFAYQDYRIQQLDHIRYSLIGACLGIGVDLSLIRHEPDTRVPHPL